MKALAGFRFSHVYILESLAQMHTGRRLANALKTLPESEGAIRFAEVTSRQDLFAKLSGIAAEVFSTGEIPILHLECHGTLDGLGLRLSSEECVSWEDLRAPLEQINIHCGLHMLLVLGVCRGARILKLVNPTERAPFWGYLGSDELISAGAIEDAFPPFYTTLFKTKDLVAAVTELRRYGLPLDPVSVEHFFILAYRAYLRDHFGPRILRERVRDLAREVGRPVGQVKRKLLASRKPSFRKHRRDFFMFDLFPENADRFWVSFQDVQPER